MPVLARLTAALADRYRLERELGRGGMATVYLADDVRHGRAVAVKVLDEAVGASLGAERFLAEIRTTARLQHPHILTLIDSGAACLERDAAGDRAKAATLLHEALAIYARIGMPKHMELARALLAQAG